MSKLSDERDARRESLLYSVRIPGLGSAADEPESDKNPAAKPTGPEKGKRKPPLETTSLP
ncbi:hypothetical protein ACHAWF_008001 [Thalassiosira exigua]